MFLTTQYLDEADQLADNIVVVDHGRIIAQGTPLELKDQSGAASLVVTVSRPTRGRRGGRDRARRGRRDPRRPRRPAITAPAEGVGALTRIAARLDEAGIDLDDIGLQRPSLDDVFLNLTGHRAEVEQEPSHDEQITEAVR